MQESPLIIFLPARLHVRFAFFAKILSGGVAAASCEGLHFFAEFGMSSVSSVFTGFALPGISDFDKGGFMERPDYWESMFENSL